MSSESLHTKCRKCGRSVFKSDSKCPACGESLGFSKQVKPVWVVVAVLVLLVFIGSLGENAPPSIHTKPKPPTTTSVSTYPPLEIQSWHCVTEHGFIFVRGEVKNVSSEKIENVMVVGRFYTKGGDFVKAETALIDYNPIMPDQTSPFETIGTENPKITNCKVSFKTLFGKSIPYTAKK